MISARNRDVSFRKAIRKKRIAEEIYYHGFNYYDNLHQYSKNKIHCSCPACSAKTRNKGKRRNKSGNYADSINYKITDFRRICSMEENLIDEGFNIPHHRHRDRFI